MCWVPQTRGHFGRVRGLPVSRAAGQSTDGQVILKRLGAKLRFVFRNMPLSEIHPYAELAAECRGSRCGTGEILGNCTMRCTNIRTSLDQICWRPSPKRLRLDTSRFEDDLVRVGFATT